MLTGHCATLAQTVERLTRNAQVDSSILSSGSTALDVRRFSEHLGFCICASVRIGFRRARMVIARVAELVDAQDLGSCVFDVWVQVPSRAPFLYRRMRLIQPTCTVPYCERFRVSSPPLYLRWQAVRS